MITSPNGKGVILIGGSKIYPAKTHFDYSDALIELKGNCKKSIKWNIMEQKLQHGRKDHIAFSIPDHLLKKL